MTKNFPNIKIFSDGADLAQMIAIAQNPLIQGLTTNPTLMKKAGITSYKTFAKEVLANIKTKPISFEVFSDDFTEMQRQALEINSWGSNVYVKIPITNSRGQSSQELIQVLTQQGVKLNVTAVLTLEQVRLTCNTLKNGAPSVVSVFAGRIADTSYDPVPLLRQARGICTAASSSIELLWASSREVLNISQAADAGCHIITVTNDLLKKFTAMIGMDLAELSLETVKMFKNDAESAGYTL